MRIVNALFGWFLSIFGLRSPPPQQTKEATEAMIGPYDGISLHQLTQHLLILGASGSGKTTSAADCISRFLLQQGCSILWLAAKRDEVSRALWLAKETGREDDVILFAPTGEHRFQFLDYELNAEGGGAQSAGALLADLVEFSSRSDPSQSKEPFWALSASRMLKM